MASSKILSIIPRAPETGLFFSIRYNDHGVVSRLLAEQKLTARGLLFDGRHHDRHASLRQQAKAAGLEVWLDTQAMELALPSGLSAKHRALPWARMPREAGAYTARTCKRIAVQMAEFTVGAGYSRVLAPAHFIDRTDSMWPTVDGALTRELRLALNDRGGSDISLVYPVALHSHVLHEPGFCKALVRQLATLPVEVISLRIHPFGARSGARAFRAVIESLRGLGAIDRPLMIERAGFAGTVLFAIGLVQFVEAGVAIGDTFDLGERLRPAGAKAGKDTSGPGRFVYVEALGKSVKYAVAEALLGSTQGKSRYACKDIQGCCPHGARDMLRDPRRHSVLTRQREFETLARVPARHRTESFVQKVLTPTCDNLSRAGDVIESYKDEHRRMLSIKETVATLSAEQAASPARAAVRPVRPRPPAEVIRLPLRDPTGP